MLLLLFYGIIIALIAIIISLILYARRNYGFLESLGIPVDPPTFCLGSIPNIYKTYPQYEDIKRFNKYGSVFGVTGVSSGNFILRMRVYEGSSPQIMVADPELVKLIMVKDYDHFHSRSPVDLGHSIANDILDYLPDEKWKIVRRMLTPQLTTSRLKHLAAVALSIGDDFTKDLLEECKAERVKINFRDRIATIMLNIVTSGLYGIQLENPRDPNNPMVRLMKSVLCENVKYDFRYTLIMVFPFLKKIFPKWPFPAEGLDTFRPIMKSYLETRRRENIKRNDFGDVFVDMIDLLKDPEMRNKGFTEDTAISQVVETFFSSFDTIGSSIAMLFYFLCQHPEIQQKVQEEVDSIWEKYDGDLSSKLLEAIGELTFLTACVNESMRLTPSFIRPERKCTKDWTGVRDNGQEFKIPEGANVVFPIWALHRHPKYFPDPEKFNPERFMPENTSNLHPYSFAGFGHGPKNCIGSKYAYNSIKILTCCLLREFTFEIRSDTKLDFKRGTIFFTQYAPLYLDVVKRY